MYKNILVWVQMKIGENVWYTAKAVFRKKFMSVIRKGEKSLISNLCSSIHMLETEDKNKSTERGKKGE
jgi:hypothetical protein